jgi:hypothetical protein
MPPAKDFRGLKLKSQVIDRIFLFFFFETIAGTGYAGNSAAAFRHGGQGIKNYPLSGATVHSGPERSGCN